jgi:predicted N-formylglutamate amidohydrolase
MHIPASVLFYSRNRKEMLEGVIQALGEELALMVPGHHNVDRRERLSRMRREYKRQLSRLERVERRHESAAADGRRTR